MSFETLLAHNKKRSEQDQAAESIRQNRKCPVVSLQSIFCFTVSKALIRVESLQRRTVYTWSIVRSTYS